MDTMETDKGPRSFQTTPKIPIWLTTVAVIVFILLLALTVNQAREKDIVEQFSRQQMAIARGRATGIEDFISGIEKSLILISRLPYVRGTTPEATGQGIKIIYKDLGKMDFIEMPYIKGTMEEVVTQSIKVVYDDLAGKVDFIALEDLNGVIGVGYPPPILDRIRGKGLASRPYFPEIQKTGKPYIGAIPLLAAKKTAGTNGDRPHSVIVAVPTYDSRNSFSGTVIAILSLSTIIDRYILSRNETSCCSWVMDSNGIILAHPDPALTGQSVAVMETTIEAGGSLKDIFEEKKAGYGEYWLTGNGGKPEKFIIAYAPVELNTRYWMVAVTAPYNEIVLLARKGFSNIMLGALGLIIVVIVSGMVIAVTNTRRLRLKEELKRLKEREEWQEKLLIEHRKTEGVIEGSPIPTFVLNREHRVILWNKACAELTGIDAKDMIGTDRHSFPLYKSKRPTIADVIIDADMDALKKYYETKDVQESKTVKGAYEATDFFRDVGGKPRHLYFLASPIYDEWGEVIAAIETIQDTTHQKEMDIKLEEYAESLQDELAENIDLRQKVEKLFNYLQSIIDSLPDKIFDLSKDGVINYVSHDVKHDGGIGIISKKFGGKHFADFVDEENRQFVLDIWEYAKKGIYNPYEMTVTARDGSRRNLLIRPYPVTGTDRLILVQRDITEFKALEKKFYESQKLAAIGQLSAGIAHEVRNPLSSIKMSLQILEKRMHPEGNDLKRFEIARREVEHLEKLVNDILIYAKPSDPIKKRSDLRQIIDHALALTEKSLEDKHIHVETFFAHDLSPLDVDQAMLEQAFINIYHNAIDAMEESGTLAISARQENGQIRVEIRDDGCGISTEDLPYIFNPFFTKKSSGTGLGLAQIKKIIDQHQGTVEISSEEAKGTSVIITLSAQTGEEEEQQAPTRIS